MTKKLSTLVLLLLAASSVASVTGCAATPGTTTVNPRVERAADRSFNLRPDRMR